MHTALLSVRLSFTTTHFHNTPSVSATMVPPSCVIHIVDIKDLAHLVRLSLIFYSAYSMECVMPPSVHPCRPPFFCVSKTTASCAFCSQPQIGPAASVHVLNMFVHYDIRASVAQDRNIAAEHIQAPRQVIIISQTKGFRIFGQTTVSAAVSDDVSWYPWHRPSHGVQREGTHFCSCQQRNVQMPS